MITHDQIEFVPPHDLELEAMFLGSLLRGGWDDFDVVSDARTHLRPDELYRSKHQKIYAAILSGFGRGDPADPVLVATELERRGQLADVGGREALLELTRAVDSPAHATHYADLIRDLAVRRRVIHVASMVVDDARSGTTGRELVERLERATLDLRVAEAGRGPVPVYEVLDGVLRDLDRTGGAPPGISTGLQQLDVMLGGYLPGQVVVVAGRTSMGRTSFGINAVRCACVEAGVPTLFVSLEMSREEVTRNLLASVARVDSKHLHDPRFLLAAERERLEEAAEALAAAPLQILDDAPLDVPAIRSHARRMKLQDGLGLVVVDYLQLLDGAGLSCVNRTTSREQVVAAISRALKGLARELEVPVLALAQLNRLAETRDDHRPRLSDLRESGGIENDADVVLLLFRPAYYARNDAERDELQGLAEIHVAKQRNGPTGQVRAYFRAEQTRFENLLRANCEQEAER